MTNLTLTEIRLRNGIWEGRLAGAGETGARPEIRVTHLGQPVGGVELAEGEAPGLWTVRVTIPPQAISDGVQTFLIMNGSDDTKLGQFTLIAGDAAAGDLRAEMELLRAELDMLKRAFRRHCLETA